MSAKHTPGPWTYSVGSSEIMSSHEHDFEYRIALMNPFVAGNEANASLIAAAPELLAILQVTAGNIRSLGPAGSLDSVPMPYREWLAQVDAAIAKAKGGAA